MPDYVTLTYDFIIWTSYIEQMNKIIERVMYSDGAYWGEPDKMRFRSVDSITDASEISDGERLVRSNFSVTLKGYLLPKEFNLTIGQQHKNIYHQKELSFGVDVDSEVNNVTGRVCQFQDGLVDSSTSNLGSGYY